MKLLLLASAVLAAAQLTAADVLGKRTSYTQGRTYHEPRIEPTHGTRQSSRHGSRYDSRYGSRYDSRHGSRYDSSHGTAYEPAYDRTYKEYDAPAQYSYEYEVYGDGEDPPQYTAQEERDGEVTRGSYSVVLPDGRTQTVTYTVNGDDGYVATVTYEGEARYPEH